MPASPDQIAELVAHPHESLSVELKGWLDLSTAKDKAKIVKTCIALRNNNGGYMVFGIDDKTLQVQGDGPADVQETFHPDRIQQLVTKFASSPFEVHVHFTNAAGSVLPVLEIESGVRSPVAAKADLKGDKGESLITKDRVYVRTLTSNNSVSSSEATHGDWERLAEICFSNREADVGAFLRRHLLGLSAEAVAELGAALVQAAKPAAPIEDAAIELLDRGQRHFESVKESRGPLREHGSWEIAVRVRPTLSGGAPTAAFLNSVLGTNPQLSGWPAWVDTRAAQDADSQPYVMEGGWEAFTTLEPGFFSGHIDFWRIDPTGDFYQRRALQEDLAAGTNPPTPLTIFDRSLPVLRVAEALAVAIGFARAVGAQKEHALAVACRWNGLSGRELRSWADRSDWGGVFPGKKARQNTVITRTVVPADFALSSLAQPVEQLVSPLLAVFDGYQLPMQSYEALVQRLLTRKL